MASFVPMFRRAAFVSAAPAPAIVPAMDGVERCITREFELIQQELDEDHRLTVEVNRKVSVS
jgi:hypothetical protein